MGDPLPSEQTSPRFEIDGGNKRWGTQCTYDFYSNRVTKAGKFFSPSYPQNYPPEANCQYVFSGTKNDRVKVTFQNIQMEKIDGSPPLDVVSVRRVAFVSNGTVQIEFVFLLVDPPTSILLNIFDMF
ncbi:hypothetical protein LSH36_710g00017 [Paralvinella palmiformis]|uniref:CUB domain-containing protein n=1 Tax=Paralvinella palmiformis TaxID=53620 RepID=A0AAD9J2B4_9ANNE|nr:hypothetical protein LSH36_710g00017 [Paralvinella palmiformis]